jgi:peroxiredoxin Q/BCP
VAVLGISVDSVADNRAFAEKFHFPFPLLSDPGRQVAMAYGACESPSDKYARRYTFVIGPDGRIEQAIDTKDPAGQAEALLKTV